MRFCSSNWKRVPPGAALLCSDLTRSQCLPFFLFFIFLFLFFDFWVQRVLFSSQAFPLVSVPAHIVSGSWGDPVWDIYCFASLHFHCPVPWKEVISGLLCVPWLPVRDVGPSQVTNTFFLYCVLSTQPAQNWLSTEICTRHLCNVVV